MADKGIKNLGIGVKVNKDQIKAELDQLKNMIQSTFKGIPISITDLNNALKQQSDALMRLTQSTTQLHSKLTQLEQANQQLARTNRDTVSSFLHLNEGFKGYMQGAKSLLAIQARWYGAKAVLFGLFEAPASFIKEGIQYAALIDEWNAKLLRWGASSGHVTAQAKQDIKDLTLEMRKTILEMPVDLNTLGKAVEGFIGAGIDPKVVKEMTKDIAALVTAYPEINMEQFGTAIVGFYNTFKDTIKGANTEADKFRIIMDQITAAQAKGVIRPEAFTLVMQHLGEAARMAGFTTEQMLAMSVVITDLGSRAGSAARAARGFMDQLMRPAAQEKLRAIGIEFDKNKTLAQQFDKIMTSLRDKLGAEGELPVGVASFLTTIMPVERMKAFTAMLRDWDKYKETINLISGAGGGVMAAAQPKISSIVGQWELLKNTMKELATGSSIIAGSLQEIVVSLLDMARGALYAVNPIFATKEKLDQLGNAGKTTYEVIKNLVDIFSSVWGGIKPAVSVFGDLTKAILECKNAIIFLTDVLLARLALSAIAPIVAGIKALYTSISSLILLLSMGGSVAIGSFAASFGVLGVVIGAAAFALTKYLQALDELLALQNEQFIGFNPKAFQSTRQIDAFIEGMRKQKADLLASGREETDRDVLEIERVISEAMIARARLAKGLKPQEAKKTGKEVELPDQVKTYARAIIAAEKELASAKLAIEKSYFNLYTSLLESSYRLGYIEDEAYRDARIKNAEEILNKELAILETERQEIIKNYNLDIARAGMNAKEREAINKKKEADLKRIEQREIELRNNTLKSTNSIEEQYELKRRERLDRRYKFESQMAELITKDQIARAIWRLEEQNKQSQFLYEKFRISPISFYQQEIANANAVAEEKKKLAEAEYNRWLNDQTMRMQLAIEGSKEQEQLWQETQIKHQEMVNKQEEAEREKASRIRDINRKMAEDIRLTYEHLGVGGVIDKTLQDIASEYTNMGRNISDAMIDAASSMTSAMGEFFDYNSEKWLDMRSLVLDVCHDIYKALVQALIIKPIVGGIAGLLTPKTVGMDYETGSYSIVGAQGTILSRHNGGIIPLLANIPRFHEGGLYPDERVVINKVGERYITREQNEWLTQVAKSAEGSRNVNVKIELINQSGQQLSAKTGAPKVSPSEIIVPVVIDAINRNYMGLRDALGSR